MSEAEIETADPADDEEPVEPIEGDDEDTLEPEDLGEVNDVELESEALAFERDKEWERVNKYLAKNLGEIEGDDALHYIECLLCRSYGTPGFVNPSAGMAPEVASALLSWLGQPDPSEYKPDPDAITCQVCNGFGQVLTGSKVQGQETLPCMECGGKGWLPTEASRRGRGGTLPNGASAPLTPSEEIAPIVTPAELSPAAKEAQSEGYIVVPRVTVS